MHDLDSIQEQHSELTRKSLFREIKSTLDDYQSFGRRSGNTTRQVDLAIQYLFKGYVVRVLDHYLDGREVRVNKRLLSLIEDRLNVEHSTVQYKVTDKNFEYTIELLNQ